MYKYMPKNGIEPIFKSYKEFVLPIKLFWLYFKNILLFINNNLLTILHYS